MTHLGSARSLFKQVADFVRRRCWDRRMAGVHDDGLAQICIMRHWRAAQRPVPEVMHGTLPAVLARPAALLNVAEWPAPPRRTLRGPAPPMRRRQNPNGITRSQHKAQEALTTPHVAKYSTTALANIRMPSLVLESRNRKVQVTVV